MSIRGARGGSIALVMGAVACGNASSTESPDGGAPPPVSADGGAPVDAAAPPSTSPPPGGASDAGVTAGGAGCAPLALDPGSTRGGAQGLGVTWYDEACRPRATTLVRNDAKDALGTMGGYARYFEYEAPGATPAKRTCTGSGASGWQGFGYVVAHYDGGFTETSGIAGTGETVLAGRHHAIHAFHWRIHPAGGDVDVTVHWLFATGRSHPLYAITYDATPAGPDAVRADSRAPYGDVNFDGVGGDVDGIAWADHYRFTTTGTGPATMQSAWDYTQPNAVPFAMEWSRAHDAEMGIVQTQTWDALPAGGDYGGGLLQTHWGKSGTGLFEDWLWPYQLNNYEIASTTTSHRLAWGATFGAVGQRSYTTFGQTRSGYPFTSYAVYVVLGSHAAHAVDGAAANVAAAAHTTLTATRGTVAASGPAGVGRADVVTYAPAGLNPVYDTWEAAAAGNAATLTFDTGAGTLRDPTVVLRGYAAGAPPHAVTFAGRPLVADVDYFATVDPARKTLWLTLHLAITGKGTLTVD